jgi:two-component system phosphate regulon sensor histidine kinase PhoR
VTALSQDIYRSLATHAADGIIVSDEHGSILSCNPALARAIGDSEANIIGRQLFSVVECSCASQSNSGEAKFDRLTLASPANPNLHNGTLVSRVGTDLTMPVSHIALLDETEKVQGFMTVVYVVQANTVQQAQTEFVSTVSHELRTPLTSIKGFADTILRAGDRLDTTQQRRYIGIIKDQADRLTRLVEDLLAVSRLESRRLQLTIRALDLEEAVQRVVRNLSDKAEFHQILSRIPQGLPQIWADGDRLEQILTNLIDNAIKYSPQDTTITINARTIESTPEMVQFSVADQGAGIPPEKIPDIFTKFSRLDDPLVRQTEGTGLGLYITKSLVVALGGTISVSSSPGSTTFTVQLPAASLEQQAARGRG